MADKLIPFDFENHEVRFFYKDNNVLFSARDVASVLELHWSGRTLNKIPKEWQGMCKLHTPGGDQETVFINRMAVYKLAFRSNSKAADRFTNKVAQIVDTIAKTGSYTTGEENQSLLEGEIIDIEVISIDPEPVQSLAVIKPIDPAEYLETKSGVIRKNVHDFKAIVKDLLGLKDNELTLSIVGAIKRVHKGIDLLAIFNNQNSANTSESSSQYLVRKEEPHYNPTELCKILGEPWDSRLLNKELGRQGFQVKSKVTDKWEPTEISYKKERDSSLNLGCWADTGKAHHSGLPVTTWRWFARVLEALDKTNIENLIADKKPKSTKSKSLKPSDPQEGLFTN